MLPEFTVNRERGKHANEESDSMRRLEVRLDRAKEQIVVGTLAEQDRRIYFEYDPAFLDAPLPTPPFHEPSED